MEIYDYLAKLIVVGDPCVGKSSFSSVAAGEDFDYEYNMTIGVDFFAVKTRTKLNKWKMYVWDTAGQENFKSITRSYYRGTAICILMFDVTNIQSFKSLDNWKEDVLNGNQDTYFVLIGNKIDKKDRKVSKTKAVEWADSNNMMYFETSVKTKIGLDIFKTILLDFEIKTPNLESTIGIKKNENLLVHKPHTNKRTCSDDCEQELKQLEKWCCVTQ
jgi:Ras-related protein Rab-2A